MAAQDYTSWSETANDNPYGDEDEWGIFAESAVKIIEVCATEGHLN